MFCCVVGGEVVELGFFVMVGVCDIYVFVVLGGVVGEDDLGLRFE